MTHAALEGILDAIGIISSTASDTVSEIVGDTGIYPLVIVARSEDAVAEDRTSRHCIDVNCLFYKGALGGYLRYRVSRFGSKFPLFMM